MNKTYFNLADYVTTPLSNYFQEEGKWQRLEYEAKGEKGLGLVAGRVIDAGEAVIDLKVKGWHKIYLALGTIGGQSEMQISLSNGGGKTIVAPTNIDVVEGVFRWQGYDYVEESFFKAVDLTDNKIILKQAQNLESMPCAVIFYIRLEEMSEKEVEEYKNSRNEKRIMYHFDQDYFAECDFNCSEDFLGRLNMLEDGNGEIIIHEVFNEAYYDVNYNSDKTPWESTGKRVENVKKALLMKDDIHKALADRAHKLGMKIYAGHRITTSDFVYAYNPNLYNDGTVDKYPEYSCKTRDGRAIKVLSFAFDKVQDLSIEKIVNNLPDNYDGVSLFFHRGLYIAFEQPVIDEVMKRYGVDARRLPRSDYRYHTVACEFITNYIRKLKFALKEKAEKLNHEDYKINLVVLFDATATKYYGCDVEILLKEKLIDSVSQGLMTHFEEIDDCLDGDGLIDMDKYINKRNKKFVQRRYFGDDSEHVCAGIKEFLEIQKKYGGDFYAALGWENKDYQYQLDLAKYIYNAGAEKIISWNANHIAKYGSKLEGVKSCGNKEKILKGECKVVSDNFRVISLNGNDISEFDPNWRG